MDIAILGAGNVGRALAARLAGHRLTFGVRDPQDPKHAATATLGALASPEDAVRAASLVVVALPWRETERALAALGPALAGKVVVDATNPIRADFSGLELGHDDSGAERLQRLLPQARVVKAFNTTGAENMADPAYPGGRVTMLIAGDDPAATATVRALADEMGFDARVAGPLALARQLEQFAWLWIHLAFKAGFGRAFAFRIEAR
jgi:predicted dinucleotide-binding enzyme